MWQSACSVSSRRLPYIRTRPDTALAVSLVLAVALLILWNW